MLTLCTIAVFDVHFQNCYPQCLVCWFYNAGTRTGPDWGVHIRFIVLMDSLSPDHHSKQWVARRLSICLFFVVFSHCCLTAFANSTYLIGLGSYDITGPAADVNMMGYANAEQIVSGVHFRLRARTFVVAEPGGERIAFVNLDACMASQLVTLKVLERLKSRSTFYTEHLRFPKAATFQCYWVLKSIASSVLIKPASFTFIGRYFIDVTLTDHYLM